MLKVDHYAVADEADFISFSMMLMLAICTFCGKYDDDDDEQGV